MSKLHKYADLFLLFGIFLLIGTSRNVSANDVTTQYNTNDCVIPESGPWPPCATGGDTSSDDCVIPESGPWPPCATGGNPAPPPAATRKVPLHLINNSSTASVCALHIYPAHSSNRGGNWLGDWPVKPNTRRTFQVLVGTYNIYLRLCNGGTAQHNNVSVTDTVTITIRDTRRVQFAPIAVPAVWVGDFRPKTLRAW